MRARLVQRIPRVDRGVPVRLRIDLVWGHPPRWRHPPRPMDDRAFGWLRTARPDGDNCRKGIQDVLVAAGLLHDDDQVAACSDRKWDSYDLSRVEVSVEVWR